MSTVVKVSLSTHSPRNTSTKPRSSHSRAIYDENNIRPETYKPLEAFDFDSVLVPVAKGVFAVRSSNKSHQTRERKKNPIATNRLNYLLDSFQQFVAEDPEISPSTLRVCQEVLRFIAKPDRQHECEEFCGIWRVEYEQLASFIDESCNFGVKPRLTYFEAGSTLIVEVPSAVHEAPLLALHAALTCFFGNIPFDGQAVNAIISSNIRASKSLVPDLRISSQNMRDTASKTVILGLAETAFSQNLEKLEEKLVAAIEANPALLLVFAIVVSEDAPYRSLKRN
ncbi:uncharacterized protein BJ212DRAFT_185988 [Suillus subaureus]|uniref:Uncharacterized protein n=1 Tax=Suillus subaureus TaxID=48587 RepID=A0A9P7EBH4_9AGAM|nr:uncharacterized protein BJ212DRAFT_185988 [Suillus subaureus]KAG1816334.1 hypothetical protein BJ212DRAFT_185988 [Suillus subaureus]